MDLMIIALTFVCVIESRGQTQFLVLKHSGCPYALIIVFFGMGAVFETNQRIRRFQNSPERS